LTLLVSILNSFVTSALLKMHRQANYRNKPLDAKVTQEMALEAAAMETRLADLKLTMLQERARREAAM
jgi:hypothetical protein